jgi:hypothetical protein
MSFFLMVILMMFVSVNSNTTGANSRAGTASLLENLSLEFTPAVVFCRSLKFIVLHTDLKFFFFGKTFLPNKTKFSWYSPWVIFFQKNVCNPSKMAVVIKNRKLHFYQLYWFYICTSNTQVNVFLFNGDIDDVRVG